MTARVFIDGQHGTTGLRIHELLQGRKDLQLLEVQPERRKDLAARLDLARKADVSILCLPDDAAREVVAALGDGSARVIDASTAHRVAPDFVYGLPELAPEQRQAIAGARYVSNPGCYPTCVALLVRPLIDAGALRSDVALSIHALSGYTGGGKPMIERWEDPSTALKALPYEAPYALDRAHKHLPEMTRYGRLELEPQFVPAVGAFRCGMRVQIPLHREQLAQSDARTLHETLAARYADERFVRVEPFSPEHVADERSLDPTSCNGKNRVRFWVIAHPAGHALLVSVLDNLGKGASGAAVQNLNLMLGMPEATGLQA
jgi:N-acetyl-gamma-glutamyl-phosphate reductase